jgi:hypothetical protein
MSQAVTQYVPKSRGLAVPVTHRKQLEGGGVFYEETRVKQSVEFYPYLNLYMSRFGRNWIVMEAFP